MTALRTTSLLLATGLLLGCSGESSENQDRAAATPDQPDTPASANPEPAAVTQEPGKVFAGKSLSQVFPDSVSKGFDEEVTQPIPAGGMAGVGRICNSNGSAIVYVGVKNADRLADDVYDVRVEPAGKTIKFQTGAPDSGVGAGASQMGFDESEYRFQFEKLDVVITIAGCTD